MTRTLVSLIGAAVLVTAIDGYTSAAFANTDLGTLGGSNSVAYAVSNGQVVGEAESAGGDYHAFSWTAAGGMVDLGTLRGDSSAASAVDHGQVVGVATTTSGYSHAFSWTAAGGMVDLGAVPGFPYSAATAVSNGQVVGPAWTTSGDSHAFSWTAGRGMVDLGTLPGFPSSTATAVSDGLVVGWAETGSGRRHAVVFSTSPQPWVGDCTGHGVVSVDAILKLVNIALGSADPSTCPSGIPAGTTVDVGLIIQAVNNALSGCSGS